MYPDKQAKRKAVQKNKNVMNGDYLARFRHLISVGQKYTSKAGGERKQRFETLQGKVRFTHGEMGVGGNVQNKEKEDWKRVSCTDITQVVYRFHSGGDHTQFEK